jgi:hypothetical protein
MGLSLRLFFFSTKVCKSIDLPLSLFKKAIDSSMADVPVEELMRLFLLAVLPCDDED